MEHDSDNSQETEAFIASCEARGCTFVPADDIINWLQSLPRAQCGHPNRVLNPSLLAVTAIGDLVPFPGKVPYRKLRSVL